VLGAYRVVDRAAAKARWLNGVPEDKKTAILPDAWFEAWAGATFAQSELGPDRPRAPNGTVQDSREFWAAGKPVYDPAEIAVPVLIVHGDLDRDCPIDMAQAVFGKLSSAPTRSWFEIRDATTRCSWKPADGRRSMRSTGFWRLESEPMISRGGQSARSANPRKPRAFAGLSRKPVLMCVKLSGNEAASNSGVTSQRRSATW
jgi:hypothetical protein